MVYNEIQINGQSLINIQHRVGIQIMKAIISEGIMQVRRKKAVRIVISLISGIM